MVRKSFRDGDSGQPIIPFIEGDGIGIDITPVIAMKVIDAVEQSLRRPEEDPLDGSLRGENRPASTAPDEWLPKETFDALKEYSVSIKGPMTTLVGGGIRSLERRPAPGTRPLPVRPSGAVLGSRAC